MISLKTTRSAVRVLRRALFGSRLDDRVSARCEILDHLAWRMRVRTYKRTLAWIGDAEAHQAWRQANPKPKPIKDRMYVLYSIAQSLAQLPGDTAECGVFRGASSYLMCLAREGRDGVRHHVFDSFSGLSEPEEADQPTDPVAYQWQAGDLCAPLEVVREKLSRFSFVDYYPGWIPERFDEVADREFAMVHVDVDLYQPTLDSVAFFYPRLVPGGMIVCDDYGSTLCPGAKQACDEVVQQFNAPPVIHLTTGQGLILKR